ncbi:short chain dehydrogenase [Pseudomassariella vexata]|uniref:Short chain dehydrogenase n=1 Tax=Pseudomassariella vexata TaxID=1141098 RepID=A0A1Y2DE66_9PEZI|nr:short chain dehydrogenase [Pseudomassariella vexata]ORY57583.1 short chain dehydrogenase [Pseudomassariella vexata]
MAANQLIDTATLAADSLFHVNGMVAVVTGGGTGIGLMMAKGLAENGASRVYILGRRLEVLEKAAMSIGKPSVKPLECDVTSKPSLQAAVEIIKQNEGFINLLICNSGIGGPQVKRPSPEMTLKEWADENFDVPMEEYTKTFAVNVSAVWFTTLVFLRLLDAGNKKGNIWQKSQVIATSSIGGFNKQNTGGYAYGQSKAAATHLVKQLAVALPNWDIRANVICPGLYPSEMSAPIIERGGCFGKDMIPLQRVGDEKDMTGAVLYLTSRAGAYCNGTVIVSDGGRLGLFPSTF